MDRLAHIHQYIVKYGDLLIDRATDRQRYATHQGNAARRINMARAVAQRTHTLEEWMAVREFYGNKCLACHRRGKITKDHVVQVSKGGSDGADNLQPLCKSCNCAKADVDYRWDSGEWAGVVAMASIVGE